MDVNYFLKRVTIEICIKVLRIIIYRIFYNMNRQKSRTFKKDKKRLELNREPQKRVPSPEMPRLVSIADFDEGRVNYKKEGITNTQLSEIDNIILNRVPSRSNSRSKAHSKPKITLDNSSKKSFQLQNRRAVWSQRTIFMRSKTIQQIIPGFIQLLKNKNLIHVHNSTCSLQTSRFSRICIYLLNLYSDSESMNDFALRLFTEQHQLTDFFKKPESNKLPLLRKQNTCRLLTYCTQINSHTIPNTKQSTLQKQMLELKNASLRLKQQLQEARQKLDILNIEVNRKKSQSSHYSYRIDKLQIDLNQLGRQQQSTKSRINYQERLLACVQQKMLDHRKHCQDQQLRKIQLLAQQEERLIESIKLHESYFRCCVQNKSSKAGSNMSSERLLQKQWRQLQRVLDDSRVDNKEKSEFSCQFFRKSQQQYASNLEKLQSRIRQKDELIYKFLALIQQLQSIRERKGLIQRQMKQGLCLQEVLLQQYAQLDKNPLQQNKLFPQGTIVFLKHLFNNLIMFRGIL